MSYIAEAINGTVNALKISKLTFGTFTFSLWQMTIGFAVLGLVVWFIRELFTD